MAKKQTATVKKDAYTIQRDSIRTRDADGERITLLPGDTIELSEDDAEPLLAAGVIVKGAGQAVQTANAVETDGNASALKGQLTKAQNALAAEQAAVLKLTRTLELVRAIDKGAVEKAEAQVAAELAAAE